LEPLIESGRYRLQERLHGASGVWLAEDLENGDRVVVKFAPEGADILVLREQARALQGIDHPAIVAPIDAGETKEGRLYSVFPFIQGRTLRHVLNEEGPMGLRRAGWLLRETAAAVGAAHAARVYHGALDPEHILIGHSASEKRDTVHVINFGSWRNPGGPSVSPAYLAPEQRAGGATAATDVYSLGTIAAEILTGRRAFRYGSESNLERQQRIGVPRGSLRKLRHQLPARVEDEIRRALGYDPVHRPADIALWAERVAAPLGEASRKPMRRVILFAALFGAVALGSTLRGCRRQ
jgi:serine/threonine-protein kinase